jgi:hypothetical protein
MHDKDSMHESIPGGVSAAESRGKTNLRGGVMARKKGHKVGKKKGHKRGRRKK